MTMGARRAAWRATAAFAALAATGAAAAPQPDAASDETTRIFEATCIRYAGQPPALRGWLFAHRLPELRGEAARSFLLNRPGKAYWVATSLGRHVVDSYEDGSCSVTAAAGNAPALAASLTASLAAQGVAVASDRFEAIANASQQSYELKGAGRAWHVAITRNGQPGNPAAPAQVTEDARAEP